MKQKQEPSFAMCAPEYISCEVINNAEMRDVCERFGVVNREIALQQFQNIYDHVSSGAKVYNIPPFQGLQDQTYVSNVAAVITRPGAEAPTAILSRFSAQGRSGEEVAAKELFETLQFKTIHSPHSFEGEADLKEIAPGVFVGGVGRTSPEALDWISDEFNIRIIKCALTNPYLYHLDCVLFRFDKAKVALVRDVVDPEVAREVGKYCDIIDVPLDVALAGATNCVRVGREILCGDNSCLLKEEEYLYCREQEKVEFVESLCEMHGLKPVFLETSEFLKSGAGLSCMFLPLRSQFL